MKSNKKKCQQCFPIQTALFIISKEVCATQYNGVESIYFRKMFSTYLIWAGFHGTSMILSAERMKREVLEERAGLKKGVTCAQRWHMGSEQDSVLSSQDGGVALQTLGPEEG